MSESTALAPVNRAAMELPEQWDRSGDLALQFALHGEERYQLAATIAKGGLTHHTKPEAVLTIMLAAYEVGLPFMQALRGMYYVNGKLAMEGHLMDALAIQRCGVRKTVVTSTTERCDIVLHRPGWDDMPASYDITDAVRAGLVGRKPDGTLFKTKDDTWLKHTEEKLYWRALSKGLKRIAPDFFGGIYTLDELENVAEAQVVASGNRSTMEELRAAIGTAAPVEPDPLAMDENDIDQLRREANAAELAGIIDGDMKNDALDAAVRGEWEKARDLWNRIRAAVGLAESSVEQGSLLS